MMLQYFTSEMTTATLVSGASGSYVGGEWVPAAGASSTIEIIVPQPVAANDLVMLEDGEHLRDYLKTYSETRVFPREENRDADVIQYGGRNYKVMQTDDRATLGNFYRFIMRWTDDR